LADFLDVEKFVRSAVMLQKTVGLDQSRVKKSFHMKKCVTAATATKCSGKHVENVNNDDYHAS
jgi:hypothetical protein